MTLSSIVGRKNLKSFFVILNFILSSLPINEPLRFIWPNKQRKIYHSELQLFSIEMK